MFLSCKLALCFSFGKPKWVKKMPEDPCYFFGRACIDLSGNLGKDRKKASELALANLQKNIKSTVLQDTELQTEKGAKKANLGFKETIISWTTQTKVTADEQAFPEYTSKKQLCMIYRLSRKDYYKQLFSKWRMAKSMALELYKKSGKSEPTGRVDKLLKAFKQCSPFRDQIAYYVVCSSKEKIDNRVKLDGKSVLIDRVIADKLKSELKKIKLSSTTYIYQVAKTVPEGFFFKIKAEYQGKPFAGLDLGLEIEGQGWKVVRSASTDGEGIASFKLEKAGIPGQRKIRVYLADLPDVPVLAYYDLKASECLFYAFRAWPNVFFDISETNKGEASSFYMDVLKSKICHKDGIKAIDQKEEADITVKGAIDAKEDGYDGNLCKSRVFVDLQFVPKAGKSLIFADDKIKDTFKFEFEKAGEKALKKAAGQHSELILKKILECY
jgi:hypothetical protein